LPQINILSQLHSKHKKDFNMLQQALEYNRFIISEFQKHGDKDNILKKLYRNLHVLTSLADDCMLEGKLYRGSSKLSKAARVCLKDAYESITEGEEKLRELQEQGLQVQAPAPSTQPPFLALVEETYGSCILQQMQEDN